jgi:hypothetical protein
MGCDFRHNSMLAHLGVDGPDGSHGRSRALRGGTWHKSSSSQWPMPFGLRAASAQVIGVPASRKDRLSLFSGGSARVAG